MSLRKLVLASLLACLSVTAQADELQDKVKANPNDAKAMQEFLNREMPALIQLISADPDAAEKKLNEISKFLESLEATDAGALQWLNRGKSSLRAYRTRLALARQSLDEVLEKFKAEPNSVSALSNYYQKASSEFMSILRSDPEKAEKAINSIKEVFAQVGDKVDQESAKKLLERYATSLDSYLKRVDSAKRLLALVGQDAAELNLDTFVNGQALSSDDLKGKVVLLDFWAVWCGPCIATFPHLREWQEKYSDQGLVIIGLTRYYNYAWNEEANRAARSQEKVTPEAENEMLVKFAEHHELKHVFGIQKDSALSDFYGVTGIPQAVVIDREGKIQLIRVGSGEQNAKDIEAKIKELLAKGV